MKKSSRLLIAVVASLFMTWAGTAFSDDAASAPSALKPKLFYDFTTFNDSNMFDGATALKTIYILGTTPEEGTVALPATVKTLNPLTFAGCT